MKKMICRLFMVVFVFCFGVVWAGELSFPTTEAEIIKTLSLKDGKTVFEGVEYVSESSKVYKIIDGKRYRVRGLKGIVDSDIVPKAGALINFNPNSTAILSDSYVLLNEFGKAMKGGLSNISIIIAGHTDSKGSDEYNQKLSIGRAQSVANYLIARYGIPSDHVIVQGYGKTKPIVSNDTESGRFKNRRVEFIRAE